MTLQCITIVCIYQGYSAHSVTGSTIICTCNDIRYSYGMNGMHVGAAHTKVKRMWPPKMGEREGGGKAGKEGEREGKGREKKGGGGKEGEHKIWQLAE